MNKFSITNENDFPFNSSGKSPSISELIHRLKEYHSKAETLFSRVSERSDSVVNQARELRDEIEREVHLLRLNSIKKKYSNTPGFAEYKGALEDALKTTDLRNFENVSHFLFDVQSYSNYWISELENLAGKV